MQIEAFETEKEATDFATDFVFSIFESMEKSS